MRFNGVDVNTIHPAVRLSKETPPGLDYDVETAETQNGESYAATVKRQNEYVITVNVAARTHEDMMSARAALAAWGSGGIGVLEPTHWPGMAYEAALQSMDAPEKRFTALEMTFVLPRPITYELMTRTASGAGGVGLRVGGTSNARPVIRQTIQSARNELAWEMGYTFLRFDGQLHAGDVVEMDLKSKGLTVNGIHRESELNYLLTDFETLFAPGMNRVTSNDGGEMQARWHNEWL